MEQELLVERKTLFPLTNADLRWLLLGKHGHVWKFENCANWAWRKIKWWGKNMWKVVKKGIHSIFNVRYIDIQHLIDPVFSRTMCRVRQIESIWKLYTKLFSVSSNLARELAFMLTSCFYFSGCCVYRSWVRRLEEQREPNWMRTLKNLKG